MGLNYDTHLGSFSYFKKVPRDPHGTIRSILTSWFEKGRGEGVKSRPDGTWASRPHDPTWDYSGFQGPGNLPTLPCAISWLKAIHLAFWVSARCCSHKKQGQNHQDAEELDFGLVSGNTTLKHAAEPAWEIAALTSEFLGSVAHYTSISVVASIGTQICLMGKVPNSICLKLQASHSVLGMGQAS